MVREYLVVARDFQWWVLIDGVRWGPYLSSAVAEASAISLAKLDHKAGQSSRVTLEEDHFRIVYDSETAGR